MPWSYLDPSFGAWLRE